MWTEEYEGRKKVSKRYTEKCVNCPAEIWDQLLVVEVNELGMRRVPWHLSNGSTPMPTFSFPSFPLIFRLGGPLPSTGPVRWPCHRHNTHLSGEPLRKLLASSFVSEPEDNTTLHSSYHIALLNHRRTGWILKSTNSFWLSQSIVTRSYTFLRLNDNDIFCEIQAGPPWFGWYKRRYLN
jgi:hypothetical protein